MLSTGLFSKTFCYFTLIQEPKTWTEAQSYCKKYNTDLATIQSDEDRYKIQEIAISMKFQDRAWMGLYDGVFAWRWSYRDLNIDYMNWEPTEETTSRTQKKCGVIRDTGNWHVASCEEQKPSFCYNGKTSLWGYELCLLLHHLAISLFKLICICKHRSRSCIWQILFSKLSCIALEVNILSVCASFSTV